MFVAGTKCGNARAGMLLGRYGTPRYMMPTHGARSPGLTAPMLACLEEVGVDVCSAYLSHILSLVPSAVAKMEAAAEGGETNLRGSQPCILLMRDVVESGSAAELVEGGISLDSTDGRVCVDPRTAANVAKLMGATMAASPAFEAPMDCSARRVVHSQNLNCLWGQSYAEAIGEVGEVRLPRRVAKGVDKRPSKRALKRLGKVARKVVEEEEEETVEEEVVLRVPFASPVVVLPCGGGMDELERVQNAKLAVAAATGQDVVVPPEWSDRFRTGEEEHEAKVIQYPSGVEIGGVQILDLGGGETRDVRLKCLEASIRGLEGCDHLVRILSPSGNLVDILDAIKQGIDLLDSEYPIALSRFGYALTLNPDKFWDATTHETITSSSSHASPGGDASKSSVRHPSWASDTKPMHSSCGCFACTHHSRAYIRHLIVADEILGEMLLLVHNIYQIGLVTHNARRAIVEGTHTEWDAWMRSYHGLE